ncbi:hypothetical protein EMIHUDRAFT_236947 [Emiliania huxleyi CCMP1516]|uniref:fructose-bisphosphate aldolase n=2 Tax=Emiliania huxleyi TaxID=2903 RepID=A0A0D3JRU9_EMIH1|nr:hypothetical protein EMIHUDRAFT_236947 [Emiliania huxleyi CCMP1516]EOD26234.1 hypothetical protein EMIHUDRAFT_236947 [Emiliania huxleyi CCMP1516]|eukprot:XP_005778663.1 hypothetical protein EMIHUDRAFT_236947 [Emiliania huxleyi CCMP1516]
MSTMRQRAGSASGAPSVCRGRFDEGLPSAGWMATIAGSVSLALHTRTVAPLYKVPVVIHSDHCAKKLLPWFDGMLEADANYARANGGVRVPHPPISLAP